jgi:DNA-binding FadR family transcriptional regulator
MVEASRNIIVTKLYDAMAQPLIFYTEVGKSNHVLGPTTIDQHRQIVTALRERSYRKLRNACEEHFRFSAEVLDRETAGQSADA